MKQRWKDKSQKIMEVESMECTWSVRARVRVCVCEDGTFRALSSKRPYSLNDTPKDIVFGLCRVKIIRNMRRASRDFTIAELRQGDQTSRF
jgi:hypothetical protein